MTMGEWWLNRYVYTVLIRGETHENNLVTRKGNKAESRGQPPYALRQNICLSPRLHSFSPPFITNYRIIKT